MSAQYSVAYLVFMTLTTLTLLLSGSLHFLLALAKKKIEAHDRRHSKFNMEFSLRLIMAAGLLTTGGRFLYMAIDNSLSFPATESLLSSFCIGVSSLGFTLEAMESCYKRMFVASDYDSHNTTTN